MTQTWFPPCHNEFNGPAWFMSDLLVFWMLTPHWAALLDQRTSAQLWMMLCFCWLAMLTPIISCVLLGVNPNVEFSNFIEFHPLTRWPIYVGGMVFAQLWLSTEGLKGSIASALSVGVLLLGLVAVGLSTPPGFNMTLLSLFWGHGFATFPMLCGLSCISAQWKPPASFVTPLAWAGRLAFQIYLLHVPVMAMGKYYFVTFPALAFWCTLLITGLIAAVAQRSATEAMRGSTKPS